MSQRSHAASGRLLTLLVLLTASPLSQRGIFMTDLHSSCYCCRCRRHYSSSGEKEGSRAQPPRAQCLALLPPGLCLRTLRERAGAFVQRARFSRTPWGGLPGQRPLLPAPAPQCVGAFPAGRAGWRAHIPHSADAVSGDPEVNIFLSALSRPVNNSPCWIRETFPINYIEQNYHLPYLPSQVWRLYQHLIFQP